MMITKGLDLTVLLVPFYNKNVGTRPLLIREWFELRMKEIPRMLTHAVPFGHVIETQRISCEERMV